MTRTALCAAAVCGVVSVAGCTVATPQKTSLEIQAFQARELETTKKVAFAAVLSVFQDLGYIVSSAEFQTGFITAKSPTKTGFRLFVGNVMENTTATGFIEQISSSTTRIRLNFVTSKETSSGYGMKSRKDTPIEDAAFYENAFSKIQEAVFIRSESR